MNNPIQLNIDLSTVPEGTKNLIINVTPKVVQGVRFGDIVKFCLITLAIKGTAKTFWEVMKKNKACEEARKRKTYEGSFTSNEATKEGKTNDGTESNG